MLYRQAKIPSFAPNVTVVKERSFRQLSLPEKGLAID
jgi:hypothetical protein